MIKDTIAQIEALLQQTPGIDDNGRAELLRLVEQLRAEAEPTSDSELLADAAQGQPPPPFIEPISGPGDRPQPTDSGYLVRSTPLLSPVDNLEASHPQLVNLADSIARLLFNTGL